ncbi:MAG: hypothetical protein IT581_03185 [Verrucomicrobiales bacterium]|nr:hypothetical protein [Verrucomicrobiales bacterium]
MADPFSDRVPGQAARLGVRKVSEIRLGPRLPKTPSIGRSTDSESVSETQRRWRVATLDRAFATLRTLPLLETRAEHLLRAIEKGRLATNVYLRRIHNFALSLSWLAVPIIPPRQWPQVWFKEKRAITRDEHRRIIEREANPERRDFYEVAWHLGASQSDIAFLDADNIDWDQRVISYARKKTGEIAYVRFGADVEAVLRLPTTADAAKVPEQGTPGAVGGLSARQVS